MQGMRIAIATSGMSAREKRFYEIRPDEWGFYDPEQAGLAALLEHLEARLAHIRLDERASRATATRETPSRRLKNAP